MKPITAMLKEGVLLGDGGYLIELERRGYVDSGSRSEKVGTGKVNWVEQAHGQF